MKNRIIKLIVGVLTTALLIGCNGLTVGEITEIKQATIIEAKRLYNWNNIEIHNIHDMANYDALTAILENRNGKIIIEISSGTVKNNSGDGVDVCGYYQHYDAIRFSEGDTVQSVFVYNPKSNAVDDILYRSDTLIE